MEAKKQENYKGHTRKVGSPIGIPNHSPNHATESMESEQRPRFPNRTDEEWHSGIADENENEHHRSMRAVTRLVMHEGGKHD